MVIEESPPEAFVPFTSVPSHPSSEQDLDFSHYGYPSVLLIMEFKIAPRGTYLQDA